MPEIITIIFNCYPRYHEINMVDPSRVGEGKRCSDAQDDLLDYLQYHHISWYMRDVTDDEMIAEQERLESLGVREITP